jgi:RND family efflux transporter MFP subunit
VRGRRSDPAGTAAPRWPWPPAHLALAVLGAVLLGIAGCGGPGAGGEPGGASSAEVATADSATGEGAAAVTPVRVDTVTVGDMEEIVLAPGETRALRETRVRAPFTGRLATLRVTDGDAVRAGDTLGAVLSRNSEAALEGARAMLAEAATRQDSADASRALELARAGLVRRPLLAPASGVILSHAASAGDLVDLGETLVVIADRSSIVFVAQLAQSDVPRVSPGQPARIDLTAARTPLSGTVHGVLPAASSGTLSAPVRIDFAGGRAPVGTGLFGQVTIRVGARRRVTIVPASAVLRDDVYGTTRVATVSGGRAIWVQVRTGLQRGDTVQILSPSLAAGTPVIVSGQVGLPDSARVQIQP